MVQRGTRAFKQLDGRWLCKINYAVLSFTAEFVGDNLTALVCGYVSLL